MTTAERGMQLPTPAVNMSAWRSWRETGTASEAHPPDAVRSRGRRLRAARGGRGWRSAGFSLIADYEQRRGGVVNFEGHGVYGWDPRGRRYTLHWFDSVGVEHGEPAFGAWDDDRLVLMHEITHTGYSRQLYEVSGDTFRFALATSTDGVESAHVPRGRVSPSSR